MRSSLLSAVGGLVDRLQQKGTSAGVAAQIGHSLPKFGSLAVVAIVIKLATMVRINNDNPTAMTRALHLHSELTTFLSGVHSCLGAKSFRLPIREYLRSETTETAGIGGKICGTHAHMHALAHRIAIITPRLCLFFSPCSSLNGPFSLLFPVSSCICLVHGRKRPCNHNFTAFSLHTFCILATLDSSADGGEQKGEGYCGTVNMTRQHQQRGAPPSPSPLDRQ